MPKRMFRTREGGGGGGGGKGEGEGGGDNRMTRRRTLHLMDDGEGGDLAYYVLRDPAGAVVGGGGGGDDHHHPTNTTMNDARVDGVIVALPPPPPPPRQSNLKNAIQTTPQHAHCRSPTLSSRGRYNPKNAAARPLLPPPSLPVADGVATLPPQTPGHALHRPFSPPLQAPKYSTLTMPWHATTAALPLRQLCQ